MSLTTTEGLTIADLEAMPADGHRYELLGGSIVVNAATSSTGNDNRASPTLAVGATTRSGSTRWPLGRSRSTGA